MDAITVSNLGIFREKKMIISNISFDIEAGSFVILSGPSGCGKSTLLKAIQGVIQKEDGVVVTGDIHVGGQIIPVGGSEFLALSGYLMQNIDAQIVNQMVEDELVFNLENHGQDRVMMEEAVIKYSELFEIDPKTQVTQLSGGQKQRLLIAACLGTGHDILLLDEPLANLDIDSVIKLLAILKKSCENGTTILCVEHRLEMISEVADKLLWLEKNTIKAYFETDEISLFIGEKAKILDEALSWNNKLGDEILSISNLNVRRGKHQVLTNFNMKFLENSITMLLGRNGCGKTSLMRVLCGLSTFREFGCTHFDYERKSFNRYFSYKKLRRKVGLVFQNPCHQLFMKTVEEELLVRNPDKSMVGEIMETFGIMELKDRHPYLLSQGEKRLVSVAVVAVAKPKLILMDEPTIGQDYLSLQRMAKTLNYLQRRYQTTFLISTHDQLAVKAFGGQSIRLD